MVAISLLGIPHDDNSSFMKGPAEAPVLIRGELHSDGYSSWSETGIDLGAHDRDMGQREGIRTQALDRIEGGLEDLLEVIAPVNRMRQLKADGQRGRCGGQGSQVTRLISASCH